MLPSPPDLNRFRHKLATLEALPQLALLGLIAGIVTALVIALFRELITLLTALFINDPTGLAFEKLPWQVRLLLPLGGAVLIIGIAQFSHRKYHRVGVVHVIERLDWHQGRLLMGNFLNQFFAGAVAISTGHSIGREGPAVHLGGASASLMGQCLRLPNNSLRLLVSCGAAAAISAAFNTPVAGVIFALEILLLEFSVTTLLPIMLASACAATLSQWFYGAQQGFQVPPMTVNPIDELPLVIMLGIAMGLLGTLFCRLITFSNKKTLHLSPKVRLLLAAAVTGILAVPAPAIMGVGYDTINLLMQESQLPFFLAVVLGCKLAATAFSVGLGVPGGLIGPTLFIGGIGGALVATLTSQAFGLKTGNEGFHVMLGMSAMMGAVMQAPLTALVTVVELTRNPELLFPSLVAIVIATLIASLLMNHKGVFEQILDSWGFDRVKDPLRQALGKEGVVSMMEARVLPLDRYQPFSTLKDKLIDSTEWLLIYDDMRPKAIMACSEALRLLEQPDEDLLIDAALNQKTGQLDLMRIPAHRMETGAISPRSTALQALELMTSRQIDSLYVCADKNNKTNPQPLGIITRESLQQHYRL
ncbi:chloride channel protein [Parendozoicomonas haliclonae]|uniref:Voltage-gated ClC-type chloride channel ClcB n=1 Tax=Parendozoicomonas haliclonae TaxID=1960125 RepID=A0A1X7AP05_9GAMM|nr:chloride channel protein [Parendozoicomonas haliclonae]SMA50016.1 Voltage-gated ClC-type chloride channel ClcB [Parendozoicomonas haliclonae]